ncbi:hypothetical protein FWK35_00020396, partial [Aphis craccivora]
MDTNSTPDKISKPGTINDVAQKDINRKEDECVEARSCIPTNKITLNPLAKDFSMKTSKSNLNNNIKMDTNSTHDNISKQSTFNDVAQTDINRKGDGCVKTLNCIPSNKITLNPLAKNFSMQTSKIDLNNNIAMDTTSTPDNISKPSTFNGVVQTNINRKGDGCVKTLNCIPHNKFTLNPLAKIFSMKTSKSDLNANLAMDTNSTPDN